MNTVWVVKVGDAIYEIYADEQRAKVQAWDLKTEDPERHVTISRWPVL